MKTGARSGPDPIVRERARAQAVRKVLPWVLASALGAAALVRMAGATWSGAAGIFGAGVLVAVFVWTLSVPRCPSCGSRLPRADAGPAATGEGAKGCARCGAA